MGVDFRRVRDARAHQIPRRLGRLGFGAATDGAGQSHRYRAAADLLRPDTPNAAEIHTNELNISLKYIAYHTWCTYYHAKRMRGYLVW